MSSLTIFCPTGNWQPVSYRNMSHFIQRFESLTLDLAITLLEFQHQDDYVCQHNLPSNPSEGILSTILYVRCTAHLRCYQQE